MKSYSDVSRSFQRRGLGEATAAQAGFWNFYLSISETIEFLSLLYCPRKETFASDMKLTQNSSNKNRYIENDM